MKRLIIATALLALVGVLVVQQLQQRWEAPLAIPAGGLELVVASGDSLRAIAAELQAAGVLEHPLLLRAYGRWTAMCQSVPLPHHWVSAASPLPHNRRWPASSTSIDSNRCWLLQSGSTWASMRLSPAICPDTR